MDCREPDGKCEDFELACPWCDGVAARVDDPADLGLVAQELRWGRPFAQRPTLPLPKIFDGDPDWDDVVLGEAEAV
jgi:hypothetical protein